ncbi:MAG: hypothetical protein IPM39_11145 [Chloroflexi bacterium]|nr:hypothetical protein [Chloroflexota bacterium]
MKSVTQFRRQRMPVRKTKEDFLRWLGEQDRGNGPAAKEQAVLADHATSPALMVWADDGGAT